MLITCVMFMSFLILLALKHFIALRPAQNGWHLQMTIWMHFLEWKFRISAGIYLKYIPQSPWQRTLVQIRTWRRTGDKPLPETTMTPHPPLICLTQHQWPCLKINGSKSDPRLMLGMDKCHIPLLNAIIYPGCSNIDRLKIHSAFYMTNHFHKKTGS